MSETQEQLEADAARYRFLKATSGGVKFAPHIDTYGLTFEEVVDAEMAKRRHRETATRTAAPTDGHTGERMDSSMSMLAPRLAAAEIARIAHYLISPDGFTKKDAAQQLAQIARKLNRGAASPFSDADMQQLLGRAKDLTPRKFVMVVGGVSV